MRLLMMTTMLTITVMGAAYAAPTPKSAMDTLTKTEQAMTKNMDSTQLDQFEKIRTAHGTLRAIDDVRKSLDRAVKACVGENTVLEGTMKTAFQKWKNNVLPEARRGQNRLDKMILTQGFAKPATVRAYLTQFDKAIAAQNASQNEVPVKDLKSCEAMQDNMDKSATVMKKLITETLGLDQEPAAVAPTPAPSATGSLVVEVPARGE